MDITYTETEVCVLFCRVEARLFIMIKRSTKTPTRRHDLQLFSDQSVIIVRSVFRSIIESMSQYEHVQHPHATHTNTDTHIITSNYLHVFIFALVIFFVLHNYVLRFEFIGFWDKIIYLITQIICFQPFIFLLRVREYFGKDSLIIRQS